MKYTNHAINILTAKTYKGIGKAWIVRNIKGGESIEDIVEMINHKHGKTHQITVDHFNGVKERVLKKIEKLEGFCDGIVAIGDKEFPRYRAKKISDSEKPVVLFYRGDIKLLDIDNSNITVIGLLNPEESIVERERLLVKEIVKNDITVVSGLAHGCDTVAHQEVLKNGGKTIAILPSPLNNILPTKNKELAEEIIEKNGLLITEYYDNFRNQHELSSRYKERDRLQALFCDAIFLVASYAKDSAERWNITGEKLDSGARLAMGDAQKYQITSAVMYNEKTDNNNPMFDLNRQLIYERGKEMILTRKRLNEIIHDIKNNTPLPLKELQSDLF